MDWKSYNRHRVDRKGLRGWHSSRHFNEEKEQISKAGGRRLFYVEGNECANAVSVEWAQEVHKVKKSSVWLGRNETWESGIKSEKSVGRGQNGCMCICTRAHCALPRALHQLHRSLQNCSQPETPLKLYPSPTQEWEVDCTQWLVNTMYKSSAPRPFRRYFSNMLLML